MLFKKVLSSEEISFCNLRTENFVLETLHSQERLSALGTSEVNEFVRIFARLLGPEIG